MYLAQAGIAVPTTLIVTRNEAPEAHIPQILARWTGTHKSARYVVRSSTCDEDAHEVSFAGASLTKTDLTIRSLLAIDLSREFFEPQPNALSVMIQPQIECLLGGVSFASDGTVVSEMNFASTTSTTNGAQPDITITSTPTTLEVQTHSALGQPIDLCELGHLLNAKARQIRKMLDFDCDVEWALTAKYVVITLQVRPITRPLSQ